jgi:hypothetical protein
MWKAVADGARMAEQADEGAGEVLVVGQRPQRAAIAVNHHRLALAHAVDHGVAAVAGEQRAVVGVRRPHHGEGEFFATVGGEQRFLAGDLVARIFPDGIVERRGLGDRQALRWRLIGRRGADEHELAGATAEQVEVEGDVLGREGDEVDHHVEFQIAKRRARRRRIAMSPVSTLMPSGTCRPVFPRRR